jgi:NTE family protein
VADAKTPCCLILAGGLGLGAYQAGAIEVLLESNRFDLRAVAGSSIGAITAALLASSPAERRLETLAAFWEAVTVNDGRAMLDPLGAFQGGIARHIVNWGSVAASRLNGIPNLARPRLPLDTEPNRFGASLYTAEPLARLLTRLIDFDRLNDGGLRTCIAACDVERGTPIFWDTASGARIGLDHILASGALMPAFAPVRIDGQRVGDGGFAVNAPLEPFLSSDRRHADWPVAILIDLFAPDQPLTGSLEDNLARSVDLQFAMQTTVRLSGLARERALEARLAPDAPGTDLFHLSYRPLRHEAGSEKTYDLARQTLRDRRQAGARDATRMLALLDEVGSTGAAGLRIHPVRLPDSDREPA